VGGAGFNAGNLGLGQFVQSDATTLNLTLGSSATLTTQLSTWLGVINWTAGGINTQTSTYSSTATFTKTGSFDNYAGSGNTFNAVTTINMQSPNNWFWNYYNNGGSVFNQNLVVTNTSTGGIYFGWGQTCTTTLAPGKIISVGGAGFNAGNLGLGQFVQSDATTLNLTLGSSATLTTQLSTWLGVINWTAGGINTQTSTYSSTATFTKTGSFDNYAGSGNTFNAVTNINMQSPNNWFWNYYNNGNTVFNQNLVVSNTSTGGIYFGWGQTCTTTLAAGKIISVGGAGFNAGNLGLGQFAQSDATTLNLTLGSSATLTSQLSTWIGVINWTAGGINTQTSTYNSAATFTKTGAFDNYAGSGNTFNAVATINTQSPNNWFWNYYNNGSSTFNQNIVISSTSTGGIYFGWGQTCTTTLVSGKTITIGGAGFNSGTLALGQFIQSGTTGFTLNLGSSAFLLLYNSTFNANITFGSGQGIDFNSSTFNGNMIFNKTGAGDVYSHSENTFNGTVTYNHSGSNNWILNYYGVSDTYNDNTIFVQTGSGTIYPAYNQTNHFKKDLSTAGSTSSVQFSYNGTVYMDGTVAENINGSSTYQPVFGKLIMDNTAGFTMNTAITVNNTLSLNNGALALNANTLTINNGATAAIAVTSGYIISENTSNLGKIQWNMGSTTGSHIFPFGTSGGLYIPMTFNLAAGTIGNVTISTYPTNAANLPLPSTPDVVTQIGNFQNNSANTVDRFWQIDKTGASGTATLTFTATPAEVGSITGLIAEHWNKVTGKWDLPSSGQTNTAYSATIPGVTNFSPWTMSGNGHPLPIQLLNFDAVLNTDKKVDLNWNTATETNNDYFTIERSGDGNNFQELEIIKGAGNSSKTLHYATVDPKPLKGLSYYRLKQTDFDGNFTYSNIDPINNMDNNSIVIFPNPVIASGNVTMRINTTEAKSVMITITDELGRLMNSKIVSIGSGDTDITIVDQSVSLTGGIYFVTCRDNQNIFTQKLIVQ